MCSETVECRWLVEGLVDGGIAVALSLSLGLVLGRRVRVDALGVVVRLEDILQERNPFIIWPDLVRDNDTCK